MTLESDGQEQDDEVVGCEAAIRALGRGMSGVATELRNLAERAGQAGQGDDEFAAAVGHRREVAAAAGTPRVIAALRRADRLDALAADDASALPMEIRERARAWLGQLAVAVLGCFDNDGVGQRSAAAPEFDVVLERTGLDALRAPIVARMAEDVAVFVARVVTGIEKNPVLVALAAELAELPPELLEPPACASGCAATWAAETRLFVTYAQVLDAVATECLLEPRGDALHPERSTFIHRMYTGAVARLDRIDWQDHVTLFERMKVPSIRGPFRDKYMDFKTGVREFDEDASGGHSLQLNIMEAMFQDTLLGWDDNAAAGFELFCQSVDKQPQPVLGEDIVREWVLDGRPTGVPLSVPAFATAWANLYTSWNAAFCSNYEEVPYFLAKLLHPSVVAIHHDRHPGLYIYTRVVTLLVHITFVMASREQAGWGRRFCELGWRLDGLNLIWGRINRAAADAYQRRIETTLEREEGFTTNLSYDAWRAAKVSLWASVRALTRTIEVTGDVGERAGEAFRSARVALGLDD